VLSDVDREHMVTNIVAHASAAVTDEVQYRVIAYWSNVDPDLGARVAAGLGKATSENGAAAQAAEVVAARANRA
jgi:catalase